MIGIVDRIEGNKAIVEHEDMSLEAIAIDLFDRAPREGDHVDLDNFTIVKSDFNPGDTSEVDQFFK